ncbi:hemicentin-2-like [Chrysemys picta bellii]|uniref:hemicentin-2-like n=1 Tax=Chrysemys picta bellii TaxID=8478 RepID=UPI0032B1D6AE
MGRIPHRPGGPWTGILLAASVLGSCLQPAPAQTPVTITPPSPVVGGGVSLAPPPPPENLVICSWFRSATVTDEKSRILSYSPATSPPQTPGPAHTGRETAGPSCALNIAGLTLSDTGTYTVQIQTPAFLSIPVTLRVYEMLPRPTVMPNQTLVLENGTFTLTCNSSPSADTVLWLRDEASLAPSDRLGLSPDNRTLTVLGAIRDDAGAYQCKVGNPISTNRSELSTVTVAYGPDSAKIDQSGSITLGSPLTLTCVADSVPAPSYCWVLNGTDTKETGSSLTFNPTTWAQQGTYECRVHNPGTCCTASASVAVWVTGTDASPPALSAGAVAGIVIGSLVGAALVGVGIYFLYTRCRNETPKENGAPVLVYENLPPTSWAGPVAQPGNPPDPSPTYQTLQPRQLDVYEELKNRIRSRDGELRRDDPLLAAGVRVSSRPDCYTAPPTPRVWVGQGRVSPPPPRGAGRAVRKGGARCQRGRTPCPVPALGRAREVLRASSAPPTTTSPVSALCPQLGTRRLCRPGSSRRVPQQRRAMGRIPHRPGGPWTGILLAASVLGSCLQPAPAQTPVTIVLTPPSPVVGGGVSLAPQPPPQGFVSCSWYRSATTDPNSLILNYFPLTPPVQQNGSAHTGRETAGPGCALNIAGLTLNDTGNYTVQIQIPTAANPVLVTVGLRVYEILPKPTVTPNQTQVLENGTFTLMCNSSPSANTVLWLRDGASLAPSERLVLSPDNQTLTVLGVTRGDAGAYQCEVRNPVSINRSKPSNVTVAYGPDSAQIDPPGPIALTLGSLLNLMCVADSIPAPSYRWVLNGTDTKETGSSLTFNLTTWAQQGMYECRAHNPVTNRTAWASVTVRVTGTDTPRPVLSAGAIAGIVIGSLAGAALVGVTVYFLYSRCQNETLKENEAPVLMYENLPPTAWAGPVAQPGSPPDPSPTYQTLQPGQQDVYEELKK